MQMATCPTPQTISDPNIYDFGIKMEHVSSSQLSCTNALHQCSSVTPCQPFLSPPILLLLKYKHFGLKRYLLSPFIKNCQTEGRNQARVLTSDSPLIWVLVHKSYQTLPVLRRCCFPKIHTNSSVSGNSSKQSVKMVIWFSHLDKTEKRKRGETGKIEEGKCCYALLIISSVLFPQGKRSSAQL